MTKYYLKKKLKKEIKFMRSYINNLILTLRILRKDNWLNWKNYEIRMKKNDIMKEWKTYRRLLNKLEKVKKGGEK